jgi:hypothetical protein
VAQHWLLSLVEVPVLTRVWANLIAAPSRPPRPESGAARETDLGLILSQAERMHVIKRQVEALALRALALQISGETRQRSTR